GGTGRADGLPYAARGERPGRGRRVKRIETAGGGHFAYRASSLQQARSAFQQFWRRDAAGSQRPRVFVCDGTSRDWRGCVGIERQAPRDAVVALGNLGGRGSSG